MTLEELKQIKQDMENGIVVSRATWMKVLDQAIDRDLLARCLYPYAKMADATNGVCCCGDNMERHANPMDCGHTETDSGSYAQYLVLQNAEKKLDIDPNDFSMEGP